MVEVLDSIYLGLSSGPGDRRFDWPSLDEVYMPGPTMPFQGASLWVLNAVYVCLDPNPLSRLDTLILDNQWIIKISCEHLPASLLATDLSGLFPTYFWFLYDSWLLALLHGGSCSCTFPFGIFHLKLSAPASQLFQKDFCLDKPSNPEPQPTMDLVDLVLLG